MINAYGAPKQLIIGCIGLVLVVFLLSSVLFSGRDGPPETEKAAHLDHAKPALSVSDNSDYGTE